MRVEECMTRSVQTCTPETSLEEAARRMWEHDCGILPVVAEHERLVGLVTDRDVCMGAYTRGQTLRDLRVDDVMSKQVFACGARDSLEQALRMMGDHRVRRVPVVDERGKLVGLLAINDMIRHAVSLAEARVRTSFSARLLEAMAVLCEPRVPSDDRLEAYVPRVGAVAKPARVHDGRGPSLERTARR